MSFIMLTKRTGDDSLMSSAKKSRGFEIKKVVSNSEGPDDRLLAAFQCGYSVALEKLGEAKNTSSIPSVQYAKLSRRSSINRRCLDSESSDDSSEQSPVPSPISPSVNGSTLSSPIKEAPENSIVEQNGEADNGMGISSAVSSAQGSDDRLLDAFRTYQSIVLQKMEDFASRMEDMNGMIRRLSSKVLGPGVDSPPLPDLPVDSLGELEVLEEWLKKPDNFTQLVDHLSVFGGSAWTDTTRMILRRVVGRNAALLFNWVGRKGKRPFKGLEISKVIVEAVLRSYKEAKVKEIELAIKNWLKSAKQRT